MTEEAKKEDLNFNLNNIKKTPNTVLSHMLIKLAELTSVQNQVKERIYYSYFIKGLDIGNKEILINIATEFDIQKNEVSNFFNPDNVEKINSYIGVAKEKEINSVPFFEIEKDVVSGAQSSANLENIIKANLEL